MPPSIPFPNGIPHAPGTVEAEDFDFGGEGIAFHETDGAICSIAYRTGVDRAVDLQSNGSNDYVIGYNGAGEWLKYTINAPEAGTYRFNFWIGFPAFGTFDFEIDGQPIMISYPNTNWAQEKIDGQDVVLTAGNHEVIIRFTEGGPNFGKFEFLKHYIIF
jgi:uncharacterized protein YegP (UPF0339 family)